MPDNFSYILIDNRGSYILGLINNANEESLNIFSVYTRVSLILGSRRDKRTCKAGMESPNADHLVFILRCK